eukprot:TRINITY_DN30461_c0_g1_i1.p1 TRINITY_DN30461_c0_g1~~TRINITY_DN30461_c0_g1_i1.p1  ORF type:complete len:202 (+),score=14.75 TRINITY_DN30461_c0_g1_i1:287-892(+)
MSPAPFQCVESTLVTAQTSRGTELRFLILKEPTPHTLSDYISTLQLYNVTHLVRVAHNTCCDEPLRASFTVRSGPGWSYDDGSAPPKDVILNWLELVDHVFGLPSRSGPRRASSALLRTGTGDTPPAQKTDPPCIAVHCKGGLGRAPVLVAVALIERCGVGSLEAVEKIRLLRKDCFNQRQVEWVRAYRPAKSGVRCCMVM